MLKNNSATKSDLKPIKTDIKRLDQKLDQKFDSIEQKFTSLKDDILTMKLEVLSEIETMRQEDATHRFSHVRTNEELEDHEARLRRLEPPTP